MKRERRGKSRNPGVTDNKQISRALTAKNKGN